HGISIRAISLLEQRLIDHIARGPTGTVFLRKSWRGSCNHEDNPNHNSFHRFLLSCTRSAPPKGHTPSPVTGLSSNVLGAGWNRRPSAHLLWVTSGHCPTAG